MQYFLGQEDRNMVNGQYGVGYYIYLNGRFSQVKEYDKCTQIIYTHDYSIRLEVEPSMELFMEVLGNKWDLHYKQQWTGDEDYTDYVPIYYPTREAFAKRNEPGSAVWYNK
jgi:hypothetical protein